MEFVAQSYYLNVEGSVLYTTVCLPRADGRFPIILIRTPYEDVMEHQSDLEIECARLNQQRVRLENGYAMVCQHCRGTGKSTGDCIPHLNERRDGLALQDWVRRQDFYNGEIFLSGGSYLSIVHYLTAPFAPDIKGAVLRIADTEQYNLCYRNGFFKAGLCGGWYVDMYKKKSIRSKNYSEESFNQLPLIDFSRTVLGEASADFDQKLLNPNRTDDFWNTPMGGSEASHALTHARIPILLTTGFYDIFAGGIFDMWRALDPETRAMSALAVHPYDHSGVPDNQPIVFPNGQLEEQFGAYELDWFNAIRKGSKPPFETGKVTYYRLFENAWVTEEFADGSKAMEIPLGAGEITYTYNPYAPARFAGGLSCNFGGTAWQPAPNSRYDIKSFLSEPFACNCFVKGKMRARLCVKSDCEDTCFYVRVSLVMVDGRVYGLRDDIQAISNVQADYRPGDAVMIDFSFDEHAFLARQGERIRIDVSSSAFPLYVRHTNQKGSFALQTTARIAYNTIVCDQSSLTLLTE